MSQANFSITYEVKEKGKNAPHYSLTNDITGQTTLENLLIFTKQALIKISDTVLAEEQARGFDKEPVLLVDGKKNIPKESVNPLGKIQYIAKAGFRELILYAYDAIRIKSKKATGRYFANNFVIFNQKVIATDRMQLELWLESKKSFEDKDFLRFVNTAPYARKLEYLGVSSRKLAVVKMRKAVKSDKVKAGTKLKSPNGAYALAYRAIKRKYKANVGLSFHFIPGNLLGLVGPGRVFSTTIKRRRKSNKAKAGRPYLYPSILLTLSSKGVIASKQ